MGRLQNVLIGHGYITTRVLAPHQDLNRGVLRLVVNAGDNSQTLIAAGRNVNLNTVTNASQDRCGVG